MISWPSMNNKTLDRAYNLYRRFDLTVLPAPYWLAFGFTLLYLALFQRHFLFSGDVWAESYAEYLTQAVTLGWKGFFQLGWAGYFNLIPKTLVDVYVWLHLPIGYIDYYYRAAVVLFTLACTSFIAHPYNRSLIKNDYLRVILALMTVMLLHHPSSFSFINVWYIGFVVIILVSLNPTKFRSEVMSSTYALFALAVCLTKPSIILLPLVVYRAVRHKEYLLGVFVSVGIGLQSLLMLSSSYLAASHIDAPRITALKTTTKLATMAFGSGVLFLKTLNLHPFSLAVVALATGVLAVLSLLLFKRLGFFAATAVGSVYLLATYAYYFAPDTPVPSVFHQYREIFNDDFKLQREIIISFLLLLGLFLLIDWAVNTNREWMAKRARAFGLFGLIILMAGLQYRPIDTQGAVNAGHIGGYRAGLNRGQSLCIPIAPTPSWSTYTGLSNATWFFQYHGGCIGLNYDKHLGSQLDPIQIGKKLTIEVPTTPDRQIKALLLPVMNPTPHTQRELTLRDQANGRTYTALLYAKSSNEKLSYVSFNLYGEPPMAGSYSFTVSEDNSPRSSIELVHFSDHALAYEALFMGYPNLDEVAQHQP